MLKQKEPDKAIQRWSHFLRQPTKVDSTMQSRSTMRTRNTALSAEFTSVWHALISIASSARTGTRSSARLLTIGRSPRLAASFACVALAGEQ